MLSAPELLEFLEDQGEDGATLARARQLIQTHELNETGGRPGPQPSGRRCPWPWVPSREVVLPLPDSAAASVKWHVNVPASQGLAKDETG